jgi:hypothetical protein
LKDSIHVVAESRVDSISNQAEQRPLDTLRI